MEWPRKFLLFGEVIHQEWAGSHGGLERLRERRADQFPPVLFGPRRDPRHSGQVLRSRGGSARPLVVQLCRRDDVHWKRGPSQRRSFLLHRFEIGRDCESEGEHIRQ